MKRAFNITYCGYKYAPEQCSVYVNNQLYAKAGTQAAHDITLLLIAGKQKEAADTVKRQIRKAAKKPAYITIGYYQEGSKSRYFFTRQLYARRDDLPEKLRIYKEYKHFLQDHDGIVNTYTVSTGAIIPGQNAAPETKVITEKADLKRPVIIHLI